MTDYRHVFDSGCFLTVLLKGVWVSHHAPEIIMDRAICIDGDIGQVLEEYNGFSLS